MSQGPIETGKEAAIVVDEQGYLKEATNKWLDRFGYTKEIEGTHSDAVCNCSEAEKGARIARVQNGETIDVTGTTVGADGGLYEVKSRLEPVDGSDNIKITNLSAEKRENERPQVIVNPAGLIIYFNEPVNEMTGYTQSDTPFPIGEVCAGGSIEVGKHLQRVRENSVSVFEETFEWADGTVAEAKVKTSMLDSGNFEMTVLEIDKVESEDTDDSVFDDVPDAEIEEVVDNVRVEGPGGDIPLAAIMLDVTEGHNDLEQYKLGAFSLYEAVDERLAEENEKNPGSTTAKVLEEVKDACYSLYLRVHRGDAELEGDREGKFSGYFN